MRVNLYRKAETEANWQYIMSCMDGILMISCMALSEEFGFGEKRLEQFLKAHTRINARLAVAAKDGLWDAKTEQWRQPQLREAYRKGCIDTLSCCLPPEIISSFFCLTDTTYSQYHRERKCADKQIARDEKVSMAEAAEIQGKVQAFRKYLSDKTNDMEVKL